MQGNLIKFAQDLSGQIFGGWTVLRPDEIGVKGYAVRYVCACSCGNEKVWRTPDLFTRASASCGCIRPNSDSGQDLSGKPFGKWTTLYPSELGQKGCHLKYFCRCVCGNERWVLTCHLVGKKSQSCGCAKSTTRQLPAKINEWTIIKRVGTANRRGRALCQCSCGVTKTLRILDLLNGHTKSCGCLRTKHREEVAQLKSFVCPICKIEKPVSDFPCPRQRGGVLYLWLKNCRQCINAENARRYRNDIRRRAKILTNGARERAAKRGLDYDIDVEWFLEKLEQQDCKCFYSGLPILFETGFRAVSIDRIDSDGGYTRNNTVLACWGVNRAKNDMPASEFINLCGLVAKHNALMNTD